MTAEPAGGGRKLAAAAPGGVSTEARERVEALLDAGSFVELDRQRAPGDSAVVGFGTIDGRDVVVYSCDRAGLGEVTAGKIVKVQDLALRNRIPIVGLHDPGTARIEEGVAALAGYAEVFRRAVRASGVIPQLSVISEASAGELGFSPLLADFVFAASTAAVGADFQAVDEAGCWASVRRLLSYLPAHSGEAPPYRLTTDDFERADPELQALVPDDPDTPYDVRDVATRLLDDRQLLEVQSHAAANVVVGFGRLGGSAVGVVANQPQVLAGAIDGDAAVKAARFVRFCDAFNVPLVSLVDVPGPGPGAPPRQLAKLLFAYAGATVPKLAVVIRRDRGAGYALMSPKQLGTDLNLAWPAAEVATAAAERGYVDEVIEPRETRRELIRGLQLCLRKTADPPSRKHSNIPL